jgi:hypothetical protein
VTRTISCTAEVPFNQPTGYRCAVGTEIDDVEIDDIGSAGVEIDFT